MSSPEVELLFLGTGTSAGVPMIGCHCDVCRSTDPRDKRTRTSCVISCGGTRVLVDTTPELRLQCVANDVHAIDAVVYTHAHADHVMGLDDVRRFNTVRGGPLDVWADAKTIATLRTCFAYAFKEPDADQKLFRPHLDHRLIEPPRSFTIGPMTWTPIPLFHGEMPVLGFRVGRLAYCTDVSRIPESSYSLLEGLDVLVIDALQWKKHTTHFTLEEAMNEARRIGARQTLFVHMSHQLPHEATNRQLPDNMKLAFDGQRVRARGD